MSMNPEFWMDGKFKSFIKSPETSLLPTSAQYSYKASMFGVISDTSHLKSGNTC